MSALLNRSAPVAASELNSGLLYNSGHQNPRNRVGRWLRDHFATLAWLSPIAVLTGLLNALNLAGAPGHGYGESTIAMRAWSIVHLGQLTPYTYSYDQPPFGWLQIAGWTGITGGFTRYPLAVDAAREAMVVSAVIAVVLLWFVARRLGLGHAASGLASIIFALSPLAITLHRSVYLDNVAMVWALLALLLATSRRKQLLGFTASAIAMGVAILSSETFVLTLPLVALVMWSTAYPENRRYTLSIAAVVVVLMCGSFVVFAFMSGQLFPSANHPSLIDGVMAQFANPDTSTAPGGAIGASLDQWRQLDPVQLFVAPVAAVVGLFIRRIRPLAVALLALIAIATFSVVADSTDTLQGPILVLVLPVSALVIALVVDHGVRMIRSRGLSVRMRTVAVAVVAAVAVGALASTWTPQLLGLLGTGTSTRSDSDASARQAQSWISSNVSKDSRLIVDNTMWVGLVASGFATDNVISFDKLDTDSAVRAQSPQGWKDSDFIVSTEQMRSTPGAKAAASAIASSVVVASFGTGSENVQVRRIVPAGASEARAMQAGELAQRMAVGNEIADNPTVSISSADTALLRSGRVDPRIPLLIGQLATAGQVEVARLPVVTGEAGLPIREVVIASVDGRALSSNGRLTAAGRDIVGSLKGSFAAQSGTAVPDGLLLRFSINVPAGIIQ